jgi:AcrR family transcriptional regulator
MKRTPVNCSNPVKPSDPSNRTNKDKSNKDKSDKARAILAGALQVFTTQGYAAASMDRLAAAAGVSKPTLYSYFQDKEGLFIALIEQLTQKNDRLLNLQDAERLPASPSDVLYHFATSVLEEFAGNQRLLTLMRLIIGESERFPELAQTFVRQIQRPLIETLSHYLASQPQLKLPDPTVAARVFVGSLMHYLIIQKLLHGSEIMPLERDRMLNGLIYLITAERN